MSDREESALSRWSRLKREQKTGAPAAEVRTGEAPPGADSALKPARPAPAQHGENPPLHDEAAAGDGAAGDGEVAEIAEEDLPDIESLTYESDFTVFMQAGVPEILKNRALAMLWKSNPVLANVDGLNDYDLDYTASEFFQIATESAEDLRRGTRRKSAHKLRREEREKRQKAASQKAGENRRGKRRRTAASDDPAKPAETAQSQSEAERDEADDDIGAGEDGPAAKA